MNNLDDDDKIYKTFSAWLEEYEDGGYDSLLDTETLVDTREPIDNFFEGREVTIAHDVTVDGTRLVHAYTKHPDYQDIKELLMANDGEWTLVAVA